MTIVARATSCGEPVCILDKIPAELLMHSKDSVDLTAKAGEHQLSMSKICVRLMALMLFALFAVQAEVSFLHLGSRMVLQRRPTGVGWAVGRKCHVRRPETHCYGRQDGPACEATAAEANAGPDADHSG